MDLTILLFPGFSEAKFFYPKDSEYILENSLHDAVENGFIRKFDCGGYGLTKHGRRVRWELERKNRIRKNYQKAESVNVIDLRNFLPRRKVG